MNNEQMMRSELQKKIIFGRKVLIRLEKMTRGMERGREGHSDLPGKSVSRGWRGVPSWRRRASRKLKRCFKVWHSRKECNEARNPAFESQLLYQLCDAGRVS